MSEHQYRWTRREGADLAVRLLDYGDGAVYRDTRTGWVGRVNLPPDARKTIRAPDGRPKVPLLGQSGKEDRDMEYRLAFLDDLEPVDGDPVGFGAVDG